MSLLKLGNRVVRNKYTKNLVMGYIRDSESSLHLEAVPMMISYLISIFYHISEHITKVRDDCHQISDDKLTVTNIKQCRLNQQGIYLNEWVQSMSNMTFTWTFLINKLKDGLHFGCM